MPTEFNNRIVIARFLATVVLFSNLFSATASTTNYFVVGNSKIKAVFINDGKLTKGELVQVIAVANQKGLTNAAEINTFHFLPAGGKGITVKSAEVQDGRNNHFDTVCVYKAGWSAMMTNTDTKFVGNFWADEEGKVSTLLREYKTTNGPSFKVSISKGVDTKLADTVVDLFVADKLRFSKNINEDKVIRRQFKRYGDVMPKSIRIKDSEKVYEMELDNYPTTVIEFKSENGKIIVNSTSSYVI